MSRYKDPTVPNTKKAAERQTCIAMGLNVFNSKQDFPSATKCYDDYQQLTTHRIGTH